MDEDTAKQLASLIGGETWDSGGGICLVVRKRSDGKVVAFSDESVCVYDDENALQAGEPSESLILV